MYITDSNGNYIPTTTIKGEDGKEVSLRISADYIQWRREDTDWTNLIALDTLSGPSGKKVLLNAVGYILQYKYDGDADWITLCDLSTYFGNTAAATAAAAANAAADRANAAAALCEDVAAGAIPSHASTHATDGSDPITPSDIGAQERFLCGRNQTIATSAWASDTTYTEYPYRASVTLPTITAVSFVEIVFSPADATSGNFAPVCDTYAGGVYLYAKAVPDAAITIPTIIVWR